MRPGQQRVIAEVDTGHDVRRAKRDLLGFGEEIIRVAVEHQPADRCQWHQLLGNDLGRVENVEAALLGLLFRKQLHLQVPLRITRRPRSPPTGRADGNRNRRPRS